MVFIDLEKAYNKVFREVLWWVLVKKGVLQKYTILTKDIYIYERAYTSIRS
jgi:hypothetical protein